MSDKKVRFIASKSEDITKWYTDVCLKAELMSYAKTKGFIVYRPDGYSLWEEIQDYFDKRIKALGVRNVQMPTLIPLSLLNKEKDFVQGFAPECAVVTMGGDKRLAEPMVVRPTSECLFSDHFKDIVHSYNDLPVKYNQWCSVVRWEKTTRPFLRGAEFLWQEGHTLHASEEEARQFALTILRLYDQMGKDLMAVPFVTGKKPDSEKFAGAKDTYTIEALMPDGQALQCGTTHYLGTGFPECFGIQYLDKDNKLKYPHYTSWGVSTRLLGAIIMVHGDDEGLVLPPHMAPTQVVIIPIRSEQEPKVKETCHKLKNELVEKGIRVLLDDSNKTPGWKFSQYEMKGIPVRIEIGPKDLEKDSCTLSLRYNFEKRTLPLAEVAIKLPEILEEIHQGMYQKALGYLKSNIHPCSTLEDIDKVLKNHQGFARILSTGEKEDEVYMKEKYSATPRVLPFDEKFEGGKDPISGKDATEVIYYARAY